jgi:EEF1A N-terminal glycine/lysine methyltransferase
VVLSDYPAEEVLSNIQANVQRNTATRAKGHYADLRIKGHEWGLLDDKFSMEERGSFGRILVADCLWMPWQHANLLQSISWFLREDGRAWIIAGFHTGREKMKGFFDEENVHAVGYSEAKIIHHNCNPSEDAPYWVISIG